jgi:hypothetical protein
VTQGRAEYESTIPQGTDEGFGLLGGWIILDLDKYILPMQISFLGSAWIRFVTHSGRYHYIDYKQWAIYFS